MVIRSGRPIIRSGFPRAGSLSGDAARAQFIGAMLALLGDTRLFWMPHLSDTTTTTEESLSSRVFTYDASIASRLATLGSGLSLTFNGTDGEADVPDADNLSFGDSVTDQPFSIIALVNLTADANIKTILSKFDLTTGNTKREWDFYVDDSEKLFFLCIDESAGAQIGRSYNTVLATSTPLLLAATYDGSRASTGIKLFLNSQNIMSSADDTNQNSGTYTAMENTASLVRLGMTQQAAAQGQFWNGSMAFVALCASRFVQNDLQAVMKLCNAYFGITL